MHQESSDSEMLQRKPKIIAAIPCFNEEKFIGSVVLKAKRYVDRVIIIDDGSTDAFKGPFTAEKAAALKAVTFDRVALGARGMAYERLDQLTVELLLGVR